MARPYDPNLIRALAGVAQRLGKQCGKTPVAFLQTVQENIFRDGIANGKVVVSTTEAGGTVNFSLPPGYDQQTVITLLQLVIDNLNGVRRIRRLRASFLEANC